VIAVSYQRSAKESYQRSAFSVQLKAKKQKTNANQMKDFRKQKVWQKSHQLTLNIYKVTAKKQWK